MSVKSQQGSVVSSWRIRITDKTSAETLPFANALLENTIHRYSAVSNDKGEVIFHHIPYGKYTLTISYIGYKKYQQKITLKTTQQTLKVELEPLTKELSEVIVTASEMKGMTSSSKIGQEAMQHLQPSSFSDLLELLPGGFSKDPTLSTPNAIRLREASIPPISLYPIMPRLSRNKYSTSSLGTAFMIDGIPINTDANMQYVGDGQYSKYSARNFLNKGVDMRMISTDDIDNVEIVRGIPSVEYSDLTSGLIRIQRKRSQDFLHARFKADLKSTLYSVGQGTNKLWKNFNLSGGLSFLESKADPRNIRETYKRVTGSLRGTKRWNYETATLVWESNLDYTGSFDNEKVDPDLNFGNIDNYKSGYNELRMGHTLKYKRKSPSLFSGLEMITSLSMVNENTEIVKFMQLSRDIPFTDATTEGVYDGRYYPHSYVANHKVEGKPRYAFLKLKGFSNISIREAKNSTLWGATWKHNKNKGRGAIFDINKPVFLFASTRPRPFYDIPATNTLALFVENKQDIPISGHLLSVMTGVVASSLMGLDKGYTMHDKFYADPRLNVKIAFDKWSVKDHPLSIQLVGGFGSHTKFPTMIQMYPDKVYHDHVQLNYYHVNPAYRRVNIRTYIFQPDNRQLKPARNLKYEFRIDMEYRKYNASITYFNETMNNGFRPDRHLIITEYRRYLTDQIDHANIKEKPDISTLPYLDSREMGLLSNESNGSKTTKKGLEWVLSTPRYTSLYTRFTFTGAWFNSTYQNSLPQYERPSIVLDGKPLPFMGRYKDDDGIIRESLNSNLLLDSYFPDLGMNISLSFQCNWFSASQRLPISQFPGTYLDIEGKEHPYTETSKKDAYLQWLKRDVNDSMFEHYTVPFLMNVNLKATKYIFEKKIQVALFVHRLFDYSPDFERKGFVVRRNQNPYFGMELNFKL